MADTTTTNLGLTKPGVADAGGINAWGGKTNTNWDTVDGIFKADGTGTGVGLKAATSAVWNAILGTLKAAASRFLIVDASDNTKAIAFDASGITAATTRTFTAPDASGTLALTANLGIRIVVTPFTSKPTVATVTIASPAVLSWTAHGLQIGQAFQVTTTGALPTGMTASTTYYVVSTGFGANSFQFSATRGGSSVITTGSQSGTHTATPFWVPDSKLLYVTAEGWGGGGGSGGVFATSSTAGIVWSSGAGTAGNYSRVTVSAATAGAGQLVTIGAAGTAGASTTPGTGGNGGQTSWGSLMVAKGGGGGGGQGGSAAFGGSVGGAGTGDIASRNGQKGSDGFFGGASAAVGANITTAGGSTTVGSGGAGGSPGSAGQGFGAGGGSTWSNNAFGATAGAVGTAGWVLITEYCLP